VSGSAAAINLADRFLWVCLRLYMSMTMVEDEQPGRYGSVLQIVINSSYNNSKQCTKSVFFLPDVGMM
jgi:hypothetical protein